MSSSFSDPRAEFFVPFLHRHLDTSIFLLSCLDRFGPVLGEHPNSGNYRAIERDGQVVAVFSLTRRGHLLVQTGGRDDLGDEILDACAPDGIPVTGVLGESAGAQSVWHRLRAHPDFRVQYEKESVLYGLDLARVELPATPDSCIRLLTGDDFEPWERLTSAFITDEGAPRFRDRDAQRLSFIDRATRRYWWGAFGGGELVSIAGIDEMYRSVAHVGGLYTRADARGRGFGQAVMAAVLRDIAPLHGISRVVLFTNTGNAGARALYSKLGFRQTGGFTMCFATTPDRET